MERKMYLSDTDKKAGGVCGGLAEYFGIDSTIIRLLTVILTLVTGFFLGVIIYLIAWAIMPHKSNF